jgi:pyridoxal phosphate enzyme (YggS family)
MIAENIQKYLNELPENVKLVAVSKTKPEEMIMEAYKTGHKIFGENKVQDLVRKYENLPKDIEWHFIGHLQTNKIKYIVEFVHLIHGVDSFKLLKAINKEAKKKNTTVNCLLQIHIAQEQTKFGFNKNELFEMLESEEFKNLENVKITGLMGMATNTDNKQQIANEFAGLKKLHSNLKNKYFGKEPHFKELSMGMSGDYKIAIANGSTMVRIGSAIFGARNY